MQKHMAVSYMKLVIKKSFNTVRITFVKHSTSAKSTISIMTDKTMIQVLRIPSWFYHNKK